MVSGQQCEPSRESSCRQATKFLDFGHNGLGRPLSAIRLGQTFYILSFDNSIRCYYIEGIEFKSQAFEKFVKFVTLTENLLGNKLKKYNNVFEREFYNEHFKTWCEENGVLWKLSAPYFP